MEAKSNGANALAVSRLAAPENTPAERRRAPEIRIDTAATLDALPSSKVMPSSQATLFGAELQPKIIPFEALPRTASPLPSPPAKPQEAPAATQAARKVPPRRKTSASPGSADDAQATLDFLPPQKTTPRVLKTSAESVIFCHQQPAAPVHRATAAALDASMILIGFGIVYGIFEQIGQPAHLPRTGWLLLAGMLGVVALFYGLLFAIAGSVSPGMRWTSLRLINFDGFAPEGRSRALRLFGCWICVLSGGIGLIWALLDEENLTWHDHISKTFPTLQESTSRVVKQR